MAGITLLGLGPGDPSLLTREAWGVLESCQEVYVRTSQHPTVANFPPGLKVHSFDAFYENGESFKDVYERIVDKVLVLGRRSQGVVYAVPGHPYVAEATTTEISRRAREEGLSLKVVEGLSFLEPAITALGIDPFPNFTLVDGLELATSHHPPFPPNNPAIVAQIHSRIVASEVKLTLMSVYPDQHEVIFVHGAGTQNLRVEHLALFEIDRSQHIGLLSCLYLPPLGENSSFESFQNIIAHLRGPNGCPWDRDQTHQSLRPNLLEEAYEVLAALDAENPREMCEEFGDLLLQIVLHTQIANEFGEFSMVDVLQGVHDKLVRRHPHVFGDTKIEDKEGVLANWERVKSVEREFSEHAETGLLNGVSTALPALLQAESYQKRAARVGFDWPDVHGVMGKIAEELEEATQATGSDARRAEIGDLLFAVVNLARWYDVDAESSLREANKRFRQRFSHIEAVSKERGVYLSDLSPTEMDILWNEAKTGDTTDRSS
jgi:tetrapyrrole methylase family protein / MazG family protein